MAPAPLAPRRLSLWPQSSIARFAVLVFAVFLGGTAILLGFLARSTEAQFDTDARALINAERVAIVAAFEREGPAAARAVIDAELRIPGPIVLRFEAPDGTSLAGNIARWPTGLAVGNRLYRVIIPRSGNPEPEAFAVTATGLPGGYRLLVGRSLAEQERLTATLMTSLVAAIGLALVLAVGIAALLSTVVSSRIRGITAVAEAVAEGDLSRRVAVPEHGARDGFDSLGSVINTMLARIEALVNELRSLTDGLAHDLRSPLTRMKARIDRLQHGDEIADNQLAAIGAEADALLAMLENSLTISRAEAGIGRDAFVPTDLAALAARMVEMYEPLADESGVRLGIAAPVPVSIRANPALLGRALANLIDNALNHGGTGGRIDVGVGRVAGRALVTVADHGRGIPAADRATALRRFGRLDAARSRTGAGLGLSLAASIARLHGGTLRLDDNNPGLRVEISLPAE